MRSFFSLWAAMVAGSFAAIFLVPEVHSDGPYVFYRNNQVITSYIVGEDSSREVVRDSVPVANRDQLVLRVNTALPGREMEVKLKDRLENEPAQWPMPEKMYVLSDIEGNLQSFVQMLLVGGVIDTDYNWTFGKGHLVLTGDFVDRGPHVTELLWLIYALEDKARAAGGYVHFILGNHEIMILSGDTRYTNRKYMDNAQLLHTSYEGLFDSTSELGRWLRTKNIVEKIGDNLFVHGGLSRQMNDLRLGIDEVNTIARPFYDDSTYNYPNKKLEVIYSDFGPFWYRGYYQEDTLQLLNGLIRKVLSRNDVRHIFTGHTIIADTISVEFRGRVVNTDVHHASGKSEAVLMENGQYYRITTLGKRFPLKLAD